MLALSLLPAQISQVKGGTSEFAYYSAMFPTGTFAEANRAGYSSLYGGGAALFGNPAGLATETGFSVELDLLLPGLDFSVSTDGIIKDPIRGLFDNAFGDEEEGNQEKILYPDLRATYASRVGPMGGGIYYGSQYQNLIWTIGAGYSVNTDIEVEMDVNDFLTRLSIPMDDESIGSDSIRALFQTALFMHFKLQTSTQSIGSGVQIPFSRPVRIGAALHRHRASYLAEMTMTGDFMAARSGLLYQFNSPDADWVDSLYMDYFGTGTGIGYGISGGVAWEPFPWLSLDFYGDKHGDIDVKGNFSGYGYKFYALDPLSDEPFDVSEINASKISLTQYNAYEIEKIKLRRASKLGTALSFRWKKHNRANFSYGRTIKRPMLSYYYKFDRTFLDPNTKEVVLDAQGNDSLKSDYKLVRFLPDYTDYLHFGLDFHNFNFGIGIQRWNGLERTIGWRRTLLLGDIPLIPEFGLGYTFVIGPALKIDFSALALPESLFKTSLKYEF
jgi:hypothetical protein